MGKKYGPKFSGVLTAFFLSWVCFTSSACSSKTVDSYTVRGEVVSVTKTGDGRSQVTILHEEIPDFKNQTGQAVGMEPMVMTFAAQPSVPEGSLQPRTKIQFTFEVHWNGPERLVLTEVQTLDPKTPLDFKGYSVE